MNTDNELGHQSRLTPGDPPRSAPSQRSPLMPERQTILTERPRAFTIEQAQEIIRHALDSPHDYYGITVNWNKGGTNRVRNVDDLNDLYSPNTVSSISTYMTYNDGSSFTFNLAYPHIVGVARPTNGTHAEHTLKRVQLELNRLTLKYVRPKIIDWHTWLGIAIYFIVTYAARFCLEHFTDWDAILIAVTSSLAGIILAGLLQLYVLNKALPFRTWLYHSEPPATNWTRGEVLGAIGILAAVIVPILVAVFL